MANLIALLAGTVPLLLIYMVFMRRYTCAGVTQVRFEDLGALGAMDFDPDERRFYRVLVEEYRWCPGFGKVYTCFGCLEHWLADTLEDVPEVLSMKLDKCVNAWRLSKTLAKVGDE